MRGEVLARCFVETAERESRDPQSTKVQRAPLPGMGHTLSILSPGSCQNSTSAMPRDAGLGITQQMEAMDGHCNDERLSRWFCGRDAGLRHEAVRVARTCVRHDRSSSTQRKIQCRSLEVANSWSVGAVQDMVQSHDETGGKTGHNLTGAKHRGLDRRGGVGVRIPGAARSARLELAETNPAGSSCSSESGRLEVFRLPDMACGLSPF